MGICHCCFPKASVAPWSYKNLVRLIVSVKVPTPATLPSPILGEKMSTQQSPRNATPAPHCQARSGRSSEWTQCFPFPSVSKIPIDLFYSLTRTVVSWRVLVAARILPSTESQRHLCLSGKQVGGWWEGLTWETDMLAVSQNTGMVIWLTCLNIWSPAGWGLRRLWDL